MGVHHGDRDGLLGEDTKTWDKAGPPETGVPLGCHPGRLASLCQVYLESGVFAARNVPFLRANATRSRSRLSL